MRRAAPGFVLGVLGVCCANQGLSAQLEGGRETLRAAFARVDITPAVGLGLQGYGPEAREARGYRQRLYARALGVVDARGERLAIVVVDLQAVSPGLHHEAIRLARTAKVAYHELLLAATHTHAAPSHYFDSGVFNENGSQIVGFDPEVLTFLAGRIAVALDSVFDSRNLRPARAAWGETSILGVSRNRSYEPYLANTGPTPTGFPAPQPLAVDPTWTMLRVDTASTLGAPYVPAGAFSVFGVHPTVIPAESELYDSDLNGYVNRRLERFIDSRAGIVIPADAPDPRARSVHLWANGAEGDVSPAWTAKARCRLPRLRRGLRPAGARAPRAPDAWDEPDAAEVDRCIAGAIGELQALGDVVVDAAEQLFTHLGSSLSGRLTIARAFRSMVLAGYRRQGIQRLPEVALVGSALMGGAEDGRTRYYGWRDLGLFSAGFEEGAAAQDPHNPDLLQRPKRRAAPLIYDMIARDRLPTATQLMVARLGDRYLTAVPAEVTTVAAYRLQQAVQRGVTAGGATQQKPVIVGLANGYLLYVTTPEEYQLQHYEGGATLYGHQTLPVLEEQFEELARSLSGAPVRVDLAPVRTHQIVRALFPRAGRPRQIVRRVLDRRCESSSVTVRWRDEPFRELIPAHGLLLLVEVSRPGQPPMMLWDDDLRVEVSAPKGGLLARRDTWQVRLRIPSSGSFRLTLLPRTSLTGAAIPALTSRFSCP